MLPNLYLRTHTSPKEWVVTRDHTYKGHTVPAGFITDLASIPWIVQFLFLNDETRKAAVHHDESYCNNKMSREDCDNMLLSFLRADGVGKLHSRLIWLGVRIGGWLHYNKCKNGYTEEDYVPSYMI